MTEAAYVSTRVPYVMILSALLVPISPRIQYVQYVRPEPHPTEMTVSVTVVVGTRIFIMEESVLRVMRIVLSVTGIA